MIKRERETHRDMTETEQKREGESEQKHKIIIYRVATLGRLPKPLRFSCGFLLRSLVWLFFHLNGRVFPGFQQKRDRHLKEQVLPQHQRDVPHSYLTRFIVANKPA